jgi:23S rRNA pseudouridine2605 synthase
METSEKLQKVLARMGIASRREAEVMITSGRVGINGVVAKLGDRVTPEDKLTLDTRPLQQGSEEEKVRIIVYNKPEGEVCTRSDPEGRATVFDKLPKLKQGRWVIVGRLDLNTTGLLLFTTDGELANRLMHPSSNIDREYVVRVRGEIDDDMLRRLKEGVMLEDGMARFSDIRESRSSGSHRWFNVVLMEGRNREVRRLWESQGVMVSRLKRARYGFIFLPSRLRLGQWEYMGQKDAVVLYEMAGLTPTEIYEPKSLQRHIDAANAKGAKIKIVASGKSAGRSPDGVRR